MAGGYEGLRPVYIRRGGAGSSLRAVGSDFRCGPPFDFDLLRAIAHHAGILLALARMAEEKSAMGELEALHRFSAFCLHDLKNLAAKLSLVVQNAELHGAEPAFQQSVMRTVTGTVQKIM